MKDKVFGLSPTWETFQIIFRRKGKKQLTQTLHGKRKASSPRTLLSFSWYPDSALKSFLGVKTDGDSVFQESALKINLIA